MQASIDSLLRKMKSGIVDRWLAAILVTYPPQTAQFLVRELDPIANPVGQTFARELGPIVDALLASPDFDRAALEPHLDPIVRIRAVQDFSASAALAFVFELKGAIRAELAAAPGARERGAAQGPQEQAAALLELEGRVDRLALLAFEIYLGCKKKMYEIRVDEMKRRTGKLLERMNRIYGDEIDGGE